MEIAKTYLIHKQNLSNRLNQIFSTVVSFYSHKNEIYLQFDNGIETNPKFSGLLTAKIFLDPHHYLSLQIFSFDNKQEKIERLFPEPIIPTWEFLSQKASLHPCVEWISHWPKEKKDFPSIIRCRFNEETFVFFLPTEKPTVTYTSLGSR